MEDLDPDLFEDEFDELDMDEDDLEDIEDESSLEIDLHMKASDLADFMDILKRMGMDTSSVNLAELEIFSDLIEALTTRE
jgi:hypothetical protein